MKVNEGRTHGRDGGKLHTKEDKEKIYVNQCVIGLISLWG